MSFNRNDDAAFELPTGELAEHAAPPASEPPLAAEPRIDESDSSDDSDADMLILLPDVEDFDDEPAVATCEPPPVIVHNIVAGNDESIGESTEAAADPEPPTFAFEPPPLRTRDETPDWSAMFLEAITERAEGPSADSGSEEEFSEAPVTAAASDETPRSLPPTPNEVGPALGELQRERERLNVEVAGLRSEVACHRTAILELVELRHRLAESSTALVATPAFVDDEDDDLADLPAPGPTLRDVLPPVRAILAPEALPSSRALPAPDELTFTREPKRLEFTPPEGRAPTAPLGLVDEPDWEAPLELSMRPPASAEFSIPARGWTVALAMIALVGVGGPLTWLHCEIVRTKLATARVRDAASGRPLDVRVVEAALDAANESPLARFDADHEYVRARALDALTNRKVGPEILTARKTVDPAAFRRVERAVERNPANVWQRLTLARLADRAKLPDARELWTAAGSLQPNDPVYWETMGDSYRLTGRLDDAVAAFGQAAKLKPTAMRDYLAMLSEVRVDLSKAMTAVPDSPVAVLSAVNFVRSEEGRRDWRTHADRLVERLPTKLAALDADELAATGELRAMVGDLEAAAEAYERALRLRPGRHAVRLQLAKLRYEQKAFAEADRHAAEIVRSDPAGPLGDEARLIRTKVELTNSGGRRPGDSRAAQ